jgi:hypothetical protein
MIAMLRHNPSNADTLQGGGGENDGDGLSPIARHMLPLLRPHRQTFDTQRRARVVVGKTEGGT